VQGGLAKKLDASNDISVSIFGHFGHRVGGLRTPCQMNKNVNAIEMPSNLVNRQVITPNCSRAAQMPASAR